MLTLSSSSKIANLTTFSLCGMQLSSSRSNLTILSALRVCAEYGSSVFTIFTYWFFCYLVFLLRFDSGLVVEGPSQGSQGFSGWCLIEEF